MGSCSSSTKSPPQIKKTKREVLLYRGCEGGYHLGSVTEHFPLWIQQGNAWCESDDIRHIYYPDSIHCIRDQWIKLFSNRKETGILFQNMNSTLKNVPSWYGTINREHDCVEWKFQSGDISQYPAVLSQFERIVVPMFEKQGVKDYKHFTSPLPPGCGEHVFTPSIDTEPPTFQVHCHRTYNPVGYISD